VNAQPLCLSGLLLLTACASQQDQLIPSFDQLEAAPEPTPEVTDEAWEDVDPEHLTLRHGFKPGQRFHYDVRHEYAVDRGRPSATGAAATPVRLVEADELVRYDVRVEAVDEWGGARLEITPLLLEIERESHDEREVELDTDEGIPSGDPEVDAEAQRVGRPLTAHIDHRGRLLSLEGAQAFLDSVADQLPPERRWDAVEDFEDRLGTRGLLRSLQELFAILPEEELAPGDSWEELLPTGNPKLEGGGHFRQTYVYLGQVDHDGHRCAKVFFWRVFDGLEEEGNGQRTWIPPHASQGSLYLRTRDGLLIDTEPLRQERLIVLRVVKEMTIFRSRSVISQVLAEEW
jgi:hypothetical protein